jgi:hypothetical protein
VSPYCGFSDTQLMSGIWGGLNRSMKQSQQIAPL